MFVRGLRFSPGFLVFLVFCLCSAAHMSTYGGVVISEFMADNAGLVRDQDGDAPDWIEIHNDTSLAVNLGGWHLTDEATNLVKWTFPATNLPPDAYLVVFASDKNRATNGAELHTNFKLSSGGEYLALVMADGVTLASAFAPAYPLQYANRSYGTGRESTVTNLIGAGSAVRILVPTDGSL